MVRQVMPANAYAVPDSGAMPHNSEGRCNAWRDHRAVRPFLVEYSDATRTAYETVLCKDWFRWLRDRLGLEDAPDMCIEMEKVLLAEQLRLWQKHQQERGLAEATVSLRSTIVKLWFRWLRDSEFRTDDPAWRLEVPRVWHERQHTPSWTRDELRRLRDALLTIRADQPMLAARDDLAFRLMGQMGMRGIEVCRLRWGDVSDRIAFTGKGNKPATLMLSNDVAFAFAEYHMGLGRDPGDDELVMGGIRRQTLSEIIRAGAREAKLSVIAGCHTLRRSFVTLALADGVPLVEVQLAARHASPTMTARYNQRKDADLTLDLSVSKEMDDDLMQEAA